MAVPDRKKLSQISPRLMQMYGIQAVKPLQDEAAWVVFRFSTVVTNAWTSKLYINSRLNFFCCFKIVLKLGPIQHRQKHIGSFECYNYFHIHQKSATCLLVMSTYPHVSLRSVFLIVSTICAWLIPRYCIKIGIMHCPLTAYLHCRRAYTAADTQKSQHTRCA